MGVARGARITFRRSGGLFAGDRLETSVDLADPREPEAAELERELAEIDLDALVRASPLRGEGADLYQYDLTVEASGQTRQLTVGETMVSGQLRPLIERLTRRAARERRAGP